MRARSTATKVALAVFAALLIAGSVVLGAFAASSDPATATDSASSAGSTKRIRNGGHPPRRIIRAMCAQDGTGLLRYVRRASFCNDGKERALKLPSDGPATSCKVL